jgi:D-alanine-D-alanine ligase
MDAEYSPVYSMPEDEEPEGEKPPPSRPHLARSWRVAVIANMKGETAFTHEGPEDAGAEFDKPETIQAICNAIESDGHAAVFFPADANLPVALRDFCPDICFNIAEGMGGDAREAQVPALLEMMHIPYTASRVLANAISLDKTMTKRIWRDCGLPTAPFQEFNSPRQKLQADLHYPLFVKPAREGTGMGISSQSIVHNEGELRCQVDQIVREYRQPALVEDYLSGREFTVGVLGHPQSRRFSNRPELYARDGFHRFPVQEIDTTHSATPGAYGLHLKKLDFDVPGSARFLIPAPISEGLALELHRLAVRAHQAIDAMDVSRVDLRLDRAGHPCLIEINTLPGLSPGFSDLCTIANKGGMTYQDLILEILYLAAARFSLLAAHPNLPIPVHRREPVPVQSRPVRQPALARLQRGQ